MAVKKPSPDTWHDETADEDTILIERREVIDRVYLGPDGDKSPLEASFESIAKYVQENAREREGMSIQFTYRAHDFHVAVEPRG